MTKFKGFTLVELLVVVAILAMLVGILLPTLTRAKDLAKDVACQGNLHSIWTPMRFFAEDNDGFLPPVYDYSLSYDGGGGYWNNLLANYGKDQLGWTPPRSYTAKENFNCPSYERQISKRGCYGMNFPMAGYVYEDVYYIRQYPGNSHWSNKQYMLEATLRPGEMYLVGDTTSPPPYGHQCSFLRMSVTSTPVFRHLGHCNVLFHDSHVEPLKDKEIPGMVGGYLPWFNGEDYYR